MDINYVLDYILPFSTDFITFLLFLSFGLIALLVILSIITDKFLGRWSCIIGSILFLSCFISLIVWRVQAGSFPIEIERENLLEVKLVEFPNGSTCQMFSVNNKNINANEFFKGMIPEGYCIKHIVYKKEYNRIFFHEFHYKDLQDKFLIVKKGN